MSHGFAQFEDLVRDADLAIVLMAKTSGIFAFELVEIVGPPDEETLRGLVEREMCCFLGVTGVVSGKIRTQLAEPLNLDAAVAFVSAVAAHWTSGTALPKAKNSGVEYLTRLYELDTRPRRDN